MPVLRRISFLCCILFLTTSLRSQTQPNTSEVTPKAAPSASAPTLGLAERKEILRKAKQSYYSLKTTGFAEFRFQAVPDWDSMYKDLHTDAVANDQLLPILKKTHFMVVVGPDGASSVSHQSDDAPPSEEVAERIRKTTNGVDQVLTGFLHTWTGFSMAPLFPDIDSDYQVEDTGTEYRVSYKEGETDLVTTIGRDYAIKNIQVTASTMNIAMQPAWKTVKSGFLLTGYDATIKTDSGGLQTLSVAIQYEELEGLNLPNAITAKVTMPDGGAIHIPLAFVDRTAKKN